MHHCCQEKGRYEVIQGQLKLPEEMAEFWQDIVKRYPTIILIIDPIRKVVSPLATSTRFLGRLPVVTISTCFLTRLAVFGMRLPTHICWIFTCKYRQNM